MARQADYLLGWLEQLGVERAVLVGHDLGGGVAQVAAVRAPQRCAGLVLTYGERLAWDLRTELWRIQGGRHFVPEDHPGRVAAAMNQVLDAADPG